LLERARAADKAEGKGKKTNSGTTGEISVGQNGSRFRRVNDRAESPVVQAERNLKIAWDLNVNDYFVLYLRQQPEGAFKEALDKLTKAHMTELLRAYRSHLNSSEISPAPSPSTESQGAQSSGVSKP
jgi:hypothetical protein